MARTSWGAALRGYGMGATLVALAGCAGESRIWVEASALALGPGGTVAFEAECYRSGGERRPCTDEVRWSSSEPSVASVDGHGRVTGKAEGRAVISASSGSAHDERTISVVPGLSVLAGRLHTPGGLVAHEDELLWFSEDEEAAERYGVYRVPIAGGMPVEVFRQRDKIVGMTADGTDLYYVYRIWVDQTDPGYQGDSDYRLAKRPLAGGPATDLARHPGLRMGPNVVVLDGYVYYASYIGTFLSGQVHRVPIAGGTPETLADHGAPYNGVVLAGGRPTWEAGGKLERYEADGTVTVLGAVDSPNDLVGTPTHLLWTRPRPDRDGVWRLALSGGEPERIARGSATFVSTGPGVVCWSEEDQVYCQRDRGRRVTVAAGVDGPSQTLVLGDRVIFAPFGFEADTHGPSSSLFAKTIPGGVTP
ncbi:MAG: Ig-like domain-containing protein [Deltaproteobacteria bacterium]|nr:MAG: Ig-like domain-containing protein [Deltaproteobacteria bacterium]